MMKWFACLLLSLSAIQSYAYENTNPYDVHASVITENGHFRIQASYEVAIDICSAYAFITDYEGAKNMPGILESKIISRTRNKVRVQRLIREQILFIPIEMKSLMEYTETRINSLFLINLAEIAKNIEGLGGCSRQGIRPSLSMMPFLSPTLAFHRL
jgi:hypothetical protein